MSNIKLFESKQIRSVWGEEEQKWYFFVQDIVEILTDSADVKQFIKRMLGLDEQLKNNWGTICILVEMLVADSKKRKVQPFFTTIPIAIGATGQGTGLGLSLSYDIVKAHGGELRVENKKGEGAAFIISLPA